MSTNVNLNLSLPFSPFLSTYTPLQQQPEFFIRFCISYKYERFQRDGEGRVTVLDGYPMGPSTSAIFRISPRILATPFLCSLHLHNFLLSFNDLEYQLRDYLTPRIVLFLNDAANRRRPLNGFYALAELEIVQQQWVVNAPGMIPMTDIMVDDGYIFEELGQRRGGGGGLSRLGIERLKKKGGFYAAGSSGESSSECSICLEDFSECEGVKVIKTPCSHVFHENCIFKWLANRNSCPLCRTEFEI